MLRTGADPPGRRLALLLPALILGAVLPWGAVAVVAAARNPLPRGCDSGTPSARPRDGVIVYSTGPALILSQADLSRPRTLVSYASGAAASPAPGSPRPAAPASAAGSPRPTAPASPAAGASPSPTPSPGGSSPGRSRFLAAALSPDARTVAFAVADPPGEPGVLRLRAVPVGGGAATELWSGGRDGDQPVELLWLGNDSLLFHVPHAFDPPETSERLVGVVGLAKGQLVQQAPEAEWLAGLHSQWPETRDLPLPSPDPPLEHRIQGPYLAVAGSAPWEVHTLLAARRGTAVRTGTQGSLQTRLVCVSTRELTPVRFSPDGAELALAGPDGTWVIQLSGAHSLTLALHGGMLDWQTPPPS